ncbi:FKBP-type peptidyl-prolyl cis-trans isomerase [Niabella sp. CC-SYL272]|uniref:FKBP-type peptidyl-prolyl cis-trans isomerase n=1 Tax=Niabella agricola TaxID=2891571 RepID=UPI001F1F2E41|nr:FKBP-type peptidyl-prolyl cis-trans isomerase [Niabella agricola]MCF3109775.1 FKBP-type peptidyl-prolyl cis-trans isomerase [Niabella agricola]
MNKKIYAGLAVILGLLIIGCIKEETTIACDLRPATSDTAQMRKYIRDSTISADVDTTNWMMWQVIREGSGARPEPNSLVTVKYMGRLMTGQGFDSSFVKNPDGAVLRLNQVIPGLYLGLSRIREGGAIKLIIPSALGYGCDSRYGSLANQPLFFNIELVKVSNQ